MFLCVIKTYRTCLQVCWQWLLLSPYSRAKSLFLNEKKDSSVKKVLLNTYNRNIGTHWCGNDEERSNVGKKIMLRRKGRDKNSGFRRELQRESVGKKETNKGWQKSLKLLWHKEQLQICLIIGSRELYYRSLTLPVTEVSRVLIAHLRNYINRVNELLNAWRFLLFFFPLFRGYKNSIDGSGSQIHSLLL